MTVRNPTASPLAISLFGPFSVLVNGAPLPRLRWRKQEAILALLTLRHGRLVDRAWLAGLLWPDVPESQGLATLRRYLTGLRRALGPEAPRLRSPSSATLLLDLAGASVDVISFDAALSRGDPETLEEAVSLYRGPLLEGWTDEWVFEERQAREQAYLQTLEKLALHAGECKDLGRAEQHLRHAVAVDPSRESAQRALMQTLAAGGSYAAAAQVYQELRRRLHRDLNAEPDPQTQALFRQLRAEARGKAVGSEQWVVGSKVKDSGPELPTAHCPLPAGTVTFFLTDIKGSTKLWLNDPEAMRQALARHDALAALVIEQHDGFLVKQRGEGDSLFAVFPRATDAVAAALDFQRALLDFGFWILDFGLPVTAHGPGSPVPLPLSTNPKSKIQNPKLKVRIALHTGEAERREGDYFGLAVNHGARLRAVGHGGQTLLSQTTAALAREELPAGASLRELGVHRLKDLQRPEPLFQLLHPELTASFPPLRSLEAFAHNLPVQLTSFIGREQEISEVKRLLETAHLLTLTGTGGCGKTRLALQVAAELVEEYPEGIWLVELAALSDPALVPQAVAAALGVREEPHRPLTATVTEVLRARTMLLVLDNCEHLIASTPEAVGCAGLAETLLRACPRLKILATSREALRIAGEMPWRVPPLSVPDPRDLSRPGADLSLVLSQYEASRLFIERAQALEPRFTAAGQNAAAVIRICSRLDGIPLAIELAAARVKVLPVEKLAERLDERFRLLTGGSRTALPRQQTLRALIDWSYRLLTGAEQTLLRRLSVFAGGWTLEAAEAVCSDFGFWILDFGLPTSPAPETRPSSDFDLAGPIQNPKSKIQNEDVLDLLTALVEKSLVQYELPAASDNGSGEARYRLLETVREFGRECLETREEEALRQQHARFFLALAEAAEPELHRGKQAEWLDRLEAEHGNLRAALAWYQAAGDGKTELRLAGALTWLWLKRNYYAEGRQRLEEALSRGSEAPASFRLKALQALGMLSRFCGAQEAARSALEESLTLARNTGDRSAEAYSLFQLGIQAAWSSDGLRAKCLGEESLALAREIGDPWLLAHPLHLLGSVAVQKGNYGEATRLFEESLGLSRGVGDKYVMAMTLGFLALLLRSEGRHEQSRQLHVEEIMLGQELKDKRMIAWGLAGVGWAAGAPGTASAAGAGGEYACEAWVRAARLMGAAEALFDPLPLPLPPPRRAIHDQTVAAARAALGEEAFAAAWAEGRAMPMEVAVAHALEKDESPARSSG